MVKVLPNNFTLVESQKILTPNVEPVAVTCSRDLLFIAVEECMIEVYDLCTLNQLAQFRTVSPVIQIAYNHVGDCIVTMERKHSFSSGFVRVYFKWRGLSTDKPMRIRMASSLQQSVAGHGRGSAEIVELPSDGGGSVSCLSCCQFTGRIAVAMGSLLRVFYLEREIDDQTLCPSITPTPHSNSPQTNIEILLDIQTYTQPLEMVSIIADYIAFISSNEARVVKLSLFHSTPDPIPDYIIPESETDNKSSDCGDEIVRDQYYQLWSPSLVWEMEKKAHSIPSHASSPSHAPNDHMEDHMIPPLVGTVHLKSITEATSEKQRDRAVMEVLGPVEYVWGQPLSVSVNQHTPSNHCQGIPDCRVLTMLYRRFSAEVSNRGGASVTQSLRMPLSQRATLPVRVQRSKLGVEGGWDGLHSVQLIPTFSNTSSGELVGISCFLANRFHSYLYDVHHRCRLLSSFSFMSQSQLATCDGVLLHALSEGSVETYTSRVFQSAIGNLPRGSVIIPNQASSGSEVEEDENVTADEDVWLRQPIPPPSLDLTLVASSKFIGCCYLATSQDYIIVVTKAENDESASNSTPSWLLQSLSMRKIKTEQLWNIYVLKLKSATSLYHQFMEFAETMRKNSPPMTQHLLSEAHTLLRQQMVGRNCSTELMRQLQENCFKLAESLCLYSKWNGMETQISHYFIMSGRPICDVIQHVLSILKSDEKKANSILLTYLNLTLFEPQNSISQLSRLVPMADKVLEIYADSHVTRGSGHVISLLLDSWLEGYSNETALTAVECQLGVISQQERCRGGICYAMLCMKTEREREAKQTIQQLPKEGVVKWFQTNQKMVFNISDLTLYPLGKLLLSVHEYPLLSLFLDLLKSNEMKFEDICTLFKEDVCLDKEFLLKHFCELVILDRSKVISKTTITKTMLLLVDILLARLLSVTMGTTLSSRRETPFVMRGVRYRWLDSVAPFGGDEEEEEVVEEEEEEGRKKCDIRLNDLLQLQTIMCSSHMTESVAARIQDTLKDRKSCNYSLSLHLLSLPHLHREKEACQLSLTSCPAIIIDYCLSLFPHNLELWAWLLNQLLGNTAPEVPHSDLHVSLYKEALGHVITLTTPEQFISLLPPSGSISFFLPFIERSFKLQYSRTTSDILHDSILSQHHH